MRHSAEGADPATAQSTSQPRIADACLGEVFVRAQVGSWDNVGAKPC